MKKVVVIIVGLLINLSLYSQEKPLNMKIIDIKKTEIKETPHNVDVRVLYNTENAQAVHIELKPGESLKPHITPVDVFFFIIEGEATIKVGEEVQNVQKNCLVESPKGIVHNISNNTEEKLRVLVVKTPRPTEKSKLL